MFRGKNVSEGQKSLAYSFTYRSAEKTLKDKEVNSAHEQLIAAFKQELSATIRDTWLVNFFLVSDMHRF